MSTAPAFAIGLEAVQAATAKQEYAPSAPKMDFFGLPNSGDSVRLRFITDLDSLIPVLVHGFAPTKPGPVGAKGWPTSMSGVCRNDRAFHGIHTECYICDTAPPSKFDPTKIVKATPKVFALACLRDETGDAVTDKVRKVKIKDGEGEAKEANWRHIVLVTQAGKNFWDNLLPIAIKYGTLCDRDYEVVRQGAGTDTNYVFIPQDRDPVLNPANPVGDGQPKGGVNWGNYAKAMGKQGLDLRSIVTAQASDEYFAKWFDSRFEVNDKGVVVPTGEVLPNSPEGKAQAATIQSKIDQLKALAKPKAQAIPAEAFDTDADDDPDF